VPAPAALDTLHAAAAEHGVTVEEPALGAWFGVRAPVTA
jgi:hypothetical protein